MAAFWPYVCDLSALVVKYCQRTAGTRKRKTVFVVCVGNGDRKQKVASLLLSAKLNYIA